MTAFLLRLSDEHSNTTPPPKRSLPFLEDSPLDLEYKSSPSSPSSLSLLPSASSAPSSPPWSRQSSTCPKLLSDLPSCTMATEDSSYHPNTKNFFFFLDACE
ncbi:hypothetical protein PGT21_033960 [Puccinia graminis f. sp. tritici]|uniref:Uncharacterized protein n=1 Tax=Puccinia graminis f. sp. tritici TaxID=56615 RepID=A0A5B0PMN2_PUCGR|nr:hypothetical protein PGT21_033960 [Puccinia graminis f. sp. tritici]